MMKHLATAMCVAALSAACTAIRVGDPPAPRPDPAPSTAERDRPAPPPVDPDVIIDDSAPRLPITGGYAPADKDDVGASAAEKIAIDEIYRRDPQRSLVESVTREVQVVAGLNYRFVVKMSGASSYRIVVYRPLQGGMSVTSFEKLG